MLISEWELGKTGMFDVVVRAMESLARELELPFIPTPTLKK
jgi:curli biogenesis system outer membrane secretion channel CsgG